MSTATLPVKDIEHERLLGIVFDISPAQASVLSCLCRGTGATTAELLDYVGISSEIKVVVSRTRDKLETHGLNIQSKPGIGYWMEPADRFKVEQLVREFVGV